MSPGEECGSSLVALRGPRMEVFTVSPSPYEAWLLEPKSER